MNPRTTLALVIIGMIIIAIAVIITYVVLCGLGVFDSQSSFQRQFDPQMTVCFYDDCAVLDFYPEEGGGMVANAMNWLLLIEPDGSAILRHGDPHWYGSITMNDSAVYFFEN